MDFKSRSAAAALPEWPRPSHPAAHPGRGVAASVRAPAAPRGSGPQPPLWSDCLGEGMPPSARRRWPRPRSRSRAARRARSPAPRGCAPAPASFPPPPAWPPSLSRGPWKRRPLGSRPPGPPDIPGIAAHNCTFPGQETSPAGDAARRDAQPPRPAGPPPSPAVRIRSARLPLPPSPPSRRARAPPPGTRRPQPEPPPPAAARALPAAGEGSGLGTCRPFPQPGPAPPRPASRWVRRRVPAAPAPSCRRGFELRRPAFLPPLAHSAQFWPFDRPPP